MIAHQHVGVDAPTGFCAGIAEGLEPEDAILVIAEDRVALIAATHEVVDGTGVLDSELARHARGIAGGDGGVNSGFRD